MALIVAAFAVYRVAVLIAEEEGPFSVMQTLRNLYLADDWIGRGIRCPACVSFWLALPATVAALILDPAIDAALWPVYWLAVAGGARWLWRVSE